MGSGYGIRLWGHRLWGHATFFDKTFTRFSSMFVYRQEMLHDPTLPRIINCQEALINYELPSINLFGIDCNRYVLPYQELLESFRFLFLATTAFADQFATHHRLHVRVIGGENI